MPVMDLMIETLLPNSYFLCSYPLLIHRTYAGYCPQTIVGFKGFPLVLGVVPETLIAVNAIEYKPIALAKRQTMLPHYTKDSLHYLFVQLGICRVGDILFLNSGVSESCLMVVLVIIFVIRPNNLMKDQLYTFLIDASLKMDKFR